MSKHAVLILGGGFGGVKAALELADDPRFDVTLVSDEDYFRYYPALYHSATGGAQRVSAIPMAELLQNKAVHFEKARAISLDRKRKTVLTKGAGKIAYDSLVIALGMTTNYFDIKGLEEFSFGIKSIDEALEFKRHLAEQLADYQRPDAH
jgi:NADH dehydrogenase